MSELKGMIAGAEEPDAEVELSAQDLRELSHPCAMERPAEPLTKPSVTAAAPSASRVQVHATPARPRRHVPVSRLFLSVVLAVGAIGALYVVMTSSEDTDQSSTQNIVERASQSEPSESSAKVVGEPVLFANPFDEHEVFEFPHGTSETEARDAVAQMLIERAVERQSQLNAQVSRNQ